jgi:Ca2+/H+ antiporter
MDLKRRRLEIVVDLDVAVLMIAIGAAIFHKSLCVAVRQLGEDVAGEVGTLFVVTLQRFVEIAVALEEGQVGAVEEHMYSDCMVVSGRELGRHIYWVGRSSVLVDKPENSVPQV